MADPTPQQLAKALTLNERMGELARGFGTTGLLTAPAPDKIENEKYYQGMPNAIGYLSDMVKNAIYGASKAAVLPSHVAGGGKWTYNDVTDMALNTLGYGGFGSMGLGAKAVGGPGGKVLGANVYQGGPHKYGPEGAAKSLEHIGKGEGAQAYGWGRYDAGNPAVAVDYKKTLSGNWDDSTRVANAVYDALGPLSDGSVLFKGGKYNKDDFLKKFGPTIADDWVNLAPQLRTATEKRLEGYLYKHDLPDEDIARYLDWDAPIRDAPSLLKGFIDEVSAHPRYDKSEHLSVAKARGEHQRIGDTPAGPGEFTGGEFMEDIIAIYGSKQAASEALGKAGIPGLKYLDQGSRRFTPQQIGWVKGNNAHWERVIKDYHDDPQHAILVASARKQLIEGQASLDEMTKGGTHNYVTWDQDVLDRMKMLERNGETFGMTGNPAMLAAGQNQDRPGPSKMALELAKRLRDQEFYAKGGI